MSASGGATEPLGRSGTPASGCAPLVVEVLEGPQKGRRFTFEAGTVVVGTGKDCEVALEDRSVSRAHASLELLPGVVRVRDLGSRNGTYYLGARIAEARVPLGGSLRVGRTTLGFRTIDDALAPSERHELHGLIGHSLAMRRMFALLERLGPAQTPVLVQGESGTGKDHVARVLHALSARASRPFVVFDCGGVNPNLIESELFGHARGAFTGAVRPRPGLLETALDGTLFLDEIGELPLGLQPRLLRALEARSFCRVGEELPRPFRARVIAATHRDLEAEVKAGRFRGDLFFRIAAAEIGIPPLRQRQEDIPVLARHFARACTQVELALSPTTLATLQCHHWPGNVRELRNSVERAVALGTLQAEPREEEPRPVSFGEARQQVLDQFERDFLRALLERHQGNASAVAREAGIARSHLYRLLEKHRLQAGGVE